MFLKPYKLSLLVLLAVSVAIAVLFWLNVSRLTKKFAQEQIPGLTLGEVGLAWNRVELTDLRFVSGDSLVAHVEAQYVDAHPTFLSFLRDEIEVRQLVIKSPGLRLIRRPEDRSRPEPAGGTTAPERIHASFRRVTLVGGKGEIEDRTVSGPPARLVLEQIDIELRNLKYPVASGSTDVDASCVIKGQPDGRAHLVGWLDPVNQSAELTLDATSLDLKNLRPYLRDRAHTIENADGTIDLRVAILMTNGVYTATGELTLANLRPPKRDQAQPRLPTLLLVQYLKLHGNRLTIPFKVTGDTRKKEHRLDLSALLSGIINQEIGNEALQKKMGLPENPEKLDMEKLEERAKKLRKLF